MSSRMDETVDNDSRVACVVSGMPESWYSDATRSRMATVPRSTALEMSAGVAGSGIRLASDRARPGVRATAVDAEASVLQRLSVLSGFFVLCLQSCAGRAAGAEDVNVLGRREQLLDSLGRSALGDLYRVGDRCLLLERRSYRLCAAVVIWGELRVGRELARVVGEILIEVDL